MGPGASWCGGWWIFPIIACVVMMVVCFGVFGRKGFKLPWRCGDSEENTDSERPLDVLKKRYAKSEITKEEFDQMKKDLSN